MRQPPACTVVVDAFRRESDGLWLAYAKDFPILIIGCGKSEQEALAAAHAGLEAVLDMKGVYLGTVHG